MKALAAKVFEKEQGATIDPDRDVVKKEIERKDLEEEISRSLTGGIKAFLDDYITQSRLVICQKHFAEINNLFDKSSAKHFFLSLHLTYFRFKQFFSCTDFEYIRAFKPDVIVTLIDDIYDVAFKINEREKIQKTNSYVDLKDVLSWRTAEIMMADTLARNLLKKPVPSYVVAVKHPIEMIYRLLYEPETLVVYASFPITTTRRETSRIEEINSFRQKLHEKYTVFDPVTIDELRIDTKSKTATLLDRWEIEGLDNDDPAKHFDIAEIESIKESLKHVIETRDYRLIDSVDCVAAYRPYWGGRPYPATGVDNELRYATLTNKAVYAVHPDEDEPQDEAGPFDTLKRAVVLKNLDTMLEELEKLQAQKKKKFN